MPNNTYTEVRIQGDPYIVDAMHGKLVDIEENPKDCKIGFLAQFIGDPITTLSESEQESRVALQGSNVDIPMWYHARMNSWGTKWDIYDVYVDSIDFVPEHAGFEASRVLICTWHTAWSPCIPALLQLSKKLNVDITIKYLDEGFTYAGTCTIINGDINVQQDYVDDDVYRGVYEVFGPKAFLQFCEVFEPKYLKSLLPIVKTFAHRRVYKSFKQMTQGSSK